MPDTWRFNHLGIILATGEWDNTRHESLRPSGILNQKGIGHWLDDRKSCGHDWNYWRYAAVLSLDSVAVSGSAGLHLGTQRPLFFPIFS